jgi:phosphoglycerol transferase
MTIIVVLAILLVLAVLLLRKTIDQTSLQLTGAVFVLLYFVQSTGYIVSDYFTGNGVDESVIYHLDYGLEGAGFVEYIGLIGGTGIFLLLGAAIAFSVFRLLGRDGKQQAAAVTPEGKALQVRKIAVLVIFPLTFICHPAVHDLLNIYDVNPITKISNWQENLFEDQAEKSEPSFDAYYQIPKLSNAHPRSPNIVYLYLESVERTYFDQSLFPGLTPELQALEKDSLSFSNIKQVVNTGWTIAGMTASQCGIPLFASSAGNSMSGMDTFLTGAVCLGDILKQRDYTLSYMGGSSLDFAGKGKFYQSHGFDVVNGKDELKPLLKDSKYMSNWGLYDDTLLDLVYQEFERLSVSGQRFGLFSLTLDTHHPKGHPSASCDGHIYADGSNEILNSVYCTDKLVAQFIRKIRSSKYGENTVVVVSSDHLAMRNTATELLQQGDRRDLLMIFHPTRISPEINHRVGSMLDVTATLLNIMGFKTSNFGLGRDLLNSEPTIVEAYRPANEMLRYWRTNVERFWNLPSADTGISIEPTDNLITVDGRSLKIPVLLEIGVNNEVRSVKFEAHTKVEIASYIEEMNSGSLLVWVDQCSKIRTIDMQLPEDNFCIFAGKLGAQSIFTAAITSTTSLSKIQLDTLASAEITEEQSIRRKDSVASMLKYARAGERN